MKNKRTIIAFSIILIIGFLARLWWILNMPLTPVYDFETLYKVAVNLFNGEGFTLNGYNWGFQSYGYPLVLSIFFRIVGSTSVFTAKIFNVIISTLTIPVFFIIYDKIFKNKKIAWFCFILSVFLPNHIAYVNVLGTEVLAVFLFSIIICMNLYLTEKNKTYNLILQGIICGVLSLVKPFFLAYPVVLIFIYFIKEKELKSLVIKGSLLIAGFLVILIPSTIKNYKQFNEFIPISYNGGFTLYINNNSQNTTGTWMNAYKVKATDEFKEKLLDVGYVYDVDAKTEKEQNLRIPKASGVFKDEAVKWIVSHPAEFVSLGFLRITRVFFAGANDVQLWGFDNNIWSKLTFNETRNLKIFLSVADILVFALSISLVIVVLFNIKNMFLKKTDFYLLLVLWSMAFFYAVHFVIEGQARYNFPTLFLMIVTLGMIGEKIIRKE